ncbi:vitamin B12 dependent-methionine synthase activation domain-containing protein [Eubacterium xylanophilum]|uniref:vitamin B12 dependent-methionine synthase activation domain-containing protein n=1 Tax=Eubacterium xylanophilum TaxID=39497 RepID=UPI0004AD617B|nr:vitamin B12 dependent-methionine synthase activation domain-containing protein [Eubacterium xylanophilum]
MSSEIINPNRREIYRYLGYKGEIPDEATSAVIEKCIGDLMSACVPGFVSREFDIEIRDKRFITFEDVTIESANLAKNLEGCQSMVVFVATLGVGPDRLIARASVSKPSEMVIYQAASAAMIEAYCNYHNRIIKEEKMTEGLHTRVRFSPGYGDFSIKHQRDIIRMLDASKKIGVTLTESLLMAPSKSVSAVIGLSRDEVECELSGCELCQKKDCNYKRN